MDLIDSSSGWKSRRALNSAQAFLRGGRGFDNERKGMVIERFGIIYTNQQPSILSKYKA